MPSFFDTSILVYSVSVGEPQKLRIAGELVEEHLVEGDGMLSVQVLREFYSASRKPSRPLSGEQAQEMVRHFSGFRTVAEDARIVLGAIGLSGEHMISFWDALIVEAALAGDRRPARREPLSLMGRDFRASKNQRACVAATSSRYFRASSVGITSPYLASMS